MFFYSLARLLSHNVDRVSEKAKARRHTAVGRSGIVKESAILIKEYIDIFVSAGWRYTKICRELWKREHGRQNVLTDDYGPLFLLPQIDDRM